MRPAAMRASAISMLLLLASCGGDSRTATPATSTKPTDPTVASSTGTTLANPPTTASRTIWLEADGLGSVSFGAPIDATVTTLSKAFGSPDRTGKGCELSGPDATTMSWKELTVQFVQGRFDGYGVRPAPGTTPSLGLTTREGVGLGATVTEIKAAYGGGLKIPGLPAEMFGGNDFAISFPGSDRPLLGSLTATSSDGTVTGFFTQVCE